MTTSAEETTEATRRGPGRQRLFLACFALLLTANAGHLTDPPYWDAVVGVYTQGAWLAQHDLDVAALAAQPTFAHGGPQLSLASSFALIYAVGIRLLAPPVLHVLLHLLNLALAALAATLMVGLLSAHMPPRLALLWTAAALADPIFSGQTATIYVEVPLAAAAMAMISAALAGHPWRAALLCLLAYTLKPTAVLFALALATWTLVMTLLERRGLLAVAADAKARWPLLVPLPLLGWLFATQTPPTPMAASSLGARLTAWVEMALQQFPVQLTVLLATLVAAAWALASPQRAGWLRRPERFAPAALLATLCWGFWLSHAIFHHPLCRYLANVGPPLVALLALLLRRVGPPRLGRVAALALLALNLANQRGALLPSPSGGAGRSGERLERSREFLDDLQQSRALCRFIEAEHGDARILAKYPFVHMLTLPELGFVSRPLPRVSAVGFPALATPARLVTPESVNAPGVLVVYSPTLYEGYFQPPLAPRPSDEVLFQASLPGGPLLLYRRR